MSTYTQIPWDLKSRHIYSPGVGKRVATVCNDAPCGQDNISAFANAAFIVRAANCHEELLAALKDVLTEMEVFDPRGNGRFMENARTALTKAEGRA